jgi:G:T-mismatch repair DNA endonuclease (very short patch repair protein)
MPQIECVACGQQVERSQGQINEAVRRQRAGPFCSFACRKKAQRKDVDVQSICRMYESGQTLDQVAAAHGVVGETIRRRLLESGVVVRERSAHLQDRNPMSGKTHSPEARAKIRAANLAQFQREGAREAAASRQIQHMAKGQSRSRRATVSSVEDLVAAELTRREVSFVRQAGLRERKTGVFFACADFLLKGSVVLEVQGTYWHSDPRVYPDGPKTASQKHTAAAFERKRAGLVRNGFRLIELWEADVKRDLKTLMDEALRG